ncbi:PadR family transcriptional regulator [Diplocloster modestus]|uniref:PadR family transcriptional regulator n=1 Tax=Diplocloster modestus TaxID=2850322 RepID=A0ABS6KCR3_9FIRM|nr:helix-turn-helix transcriptional regulator [Diplocloster modestus]MBU9728307.1 PadR family transcriptional regulator [Diplocloster modestus]
MNIDKSLLAGSTGMLILKLLEEKDMYGYEMIEELRRRSDHTFDFKAGTLYPLLHSLEDKCLLSSYENTQAPKKRKYYTITKKGLRYLSDKKAEWKLYTSAVNQILGGVSYGILS